MIKQDRSEFLQENELSLREIIESVAGEWRRLLLAALAAMALVIAGAYVFGGYAVKGLIINANPGNLVNTGNSAFDFVKWKFFRTALPDLAAKLMQEGRVKADEQDQFIRMSRPEWWDRNVVPVYAFSRDDSKLLGGVSKEFQEDTATIIQYLALESSGDTKDAAEKNLAIAVAFVISGSEYLTLKGFVSNLDAATSRAEADIRKRILSTEVEMGYLEQRSTNLELLLKRFPGSGVNATAGGQILDLKDATSKYMPLDTQLVAVNSDIYALQESHARLKNDQLKQTIVREFLTKAVPATDQHVDGAGLGHELLGIVAALRKNLDANDLFQQEALTTLEANIGSIRTSFEKGLQSSAIRQAHRVSRLALLAILGFFGGGLAMLFYVLVRKSLSQYDHPARQVDHTAA